MIKNTLVLMLLLVINISFGQEKAIKIEVVGTGAPVLFLPGFITPGAIWKETIKNLTTKNESHLFTYAGFNGVAPIEMPWYKNVKEAIFKYIEKKDLKGIRIIGHSMGGNLAIDIAAKFPKRVNKIIIVDALACMREVMMPGVAASNLKYESPYNKNVLNMSADQFKGMATNMAGFMTMNEEKKALLTKWILNADRKTYVYGYTDLLKLDLKDKLNTITAKTLILGASFPNATNAKANFTKQYANLANKTIEMASNSKHFIMFDQPTWFYTKVNTFLENE
ncbi:alpha/beta hydrolase [uncultured Tenacibaculum sp.]|uniref:alpha/beta fold hydrolase n=1 Tax=uncultured Tenacibaculum sp. TaxID=174713 RepID=UPI0026089765|nr:alpha/beta hydrolase [uncultured Tenacibaculum sp.]